jgi:4-methyl-5(b-hydroxyethyl)-thiazole monophosphate biosynthesis
MKNGLMLLGDGFEETEAITTHDILTRTHNITLKYVSISPSLEVASSMGIVVKAEGFIAEETPKAYDFLVLPGGKKGVDNLKHSEATIALINAFHDAGKPIYAICAAPSILGELGYLDGKRYTCFPGFQAGAGEYVDTGSVIDGDLVTGHSMAYTIAFAENIVRKQLGEEAVKTIYRGTRGADYPA